MIPEWVRGRPCGNSGQGKRFGLNYKCVERHQKDLALIFLSFHLQFPCDSQILGYNGIK